MAMSRSLGAMSLTTRPPISMVPALALSSPATMLSSVDLPQPDGPTSTVNSPLSISRSIPFSTSRLAYRFDRARMLNAAISTPSLDGPRSEASEEIPSAEQIHQQRRQRRDQHRRALIAKHRLGGNRGGKRDQRCRYRLLTAGRKGDAVQELVPYPGELEDDGHDQDRRRQRQDDAPENPEETGAVDPRRLQQILRDTDIVVTAEQRRETQTLYGMDHDQAGDGVHQPEIAQHHHPGDQLHLFGQEDAERHDAEQELVAAETPKRDRIAGERTQQRREDGGRDRQGKGIEHIGLDAPAMLGHAELVPGLREIGEGQMLRPGDQRGGRDFLVRAQRVGYHDAERHQEQDRQHDQQGVDDDTGPLHARAC